MLKGEEDRESAGKKERSENHAVFGGEEISGEEGAIPLMEIQAQSRKHWFSALNEKRTSTKRSREKEMGFPRKM